MLVTGEPGVGKSRLVDELAERHRDSTVVVGSRAFELGMTTSLALWVEAFDGCLARRPLPRCAACAELPARSRAGAPLGPAGAADRAAEPDREPDRERLLDALTELLDNVSGGGPVIVVLDDVHHADVSSWHALYHIASRLPDRPVLVLVTARAADLARHPAATQVLWDWSKTMSSPGSGCSR